MKKISLMILIVIIFQILFPIFTILGDSFFAVISQAETDYSNVDLSTLEEIKNNPSALAQVCNIDVLSYDSTESNKIIQQLELIRLCPNLEYLYICANGLSLDKSFFNNISSSKDITVSLQWGSINFEGIDNSKIKTLYLSENIVYNFSSIINLTNLNWLSLDTVDGFEIIDFDKMEKLENLVLQGQRIENYEDFFSKVKRVKILSLNCCNLQNSDTIFMDKLQSLEELDLYGTYVQDISFLKNLPNLKIIQLPLNVDNLDVLYEVPKLQSVGFEAVTETKVDDSLIEYFDNNNIEYPLNFDRKISTKLQKIILDFNFSADTSAEEKIEKVTEYVLKNMKCNEEEQKEIYQKEGYAGKTILDLAVQYGYGICHDYSILEYTLLTMVGIEAYYIRGYGLDSKDGCPGSHAWNMVKVNENWYGIDATWLDDDNSDPTTPEYKKFAWRKYYLKSTKTEDLNDWYQYGDEEEYMEKYFALEHRTFNDPQDTLKNIKVPNIIGITVTSTPTKNAYIQNYEELDLFGGIITITYDDGTTDTMSLTNTNIKISGFDNTKIGKNTITVEYKGKKATFDVEIVLKQIIKIEVTKLPIKTNYIQNYENIDLTGGILTIIYNDNSTDNIAMTNENIKATGFNNTILGENIITIEYAENKTTFIVKIIATNVANISKEDNTTSKERLPDAGKKNIILIFILIMSIIAFTFYRKSKKYRDIS